MRATRLRASADSDERAPGWLKTLWTKPWLGVATAALLTALTALVSAFSMPRGPTTTTQALITLLTSVVLGVASGLATRSRWALLITPLVYIVSYELGRWGAVGPTVDLPRFDTPYGVLALVLGRGVHALLALLPLLIGVLVGLALARARVKWGVLAALTLYPPILAVWLALPASTPPIRDDDGNPVPGSIAELTQVRLGLDEQTILIRGLSVDNPVLLYLSGGPGQSDLPYSRVLLADLTRDFVVVSWDQRGTGKSYASLEPATLTLEQAVEDTVALTTYLRERFGEEKIYLLGESWGTTLGVLAAQQHPELYHAFIGSGQMVSQRETDRLIYQDLLTLAAQTGDEQLSAKLRTFGEPPYADTPYANAFVMGYYAQLYKPYTPPRAYIERGSAAGLGPYGIFGSEYTLIDKVNVLRGLIDMFSVMYPQLQRVDFRADVPRLEVPVYLLDGAAELRGRRELALAWFEALEAPLKRLYTFENAAHSVAFEQFEALHNLMLDEVLPDTYPTRSPKP